MYNVYTTYFWQLLILAVWYIVGISVGCIHVQHTDTVESWLIWLTILHSNTPRLYSQWLKIMFYSATIHWAELRDSNCHRFMTIILPIVLVSLTLDGVTSFLRIKNVRNICSHLRFSQLFGEIYSVQWRKAGRI